MRVMVIVKANKDSEAGKLPPPELLAKMGKFNEELQKAGLLLAGDGLRPSSKGKRVKFGDGKRVVTDGPFAETKELIAGFWLWKVKDMEEAVDGSSGRPSTAAKRWKSANCTKWKTSAQARRLTANAN
jgi:hypothetical protein